MTTQILQHEHQWPMYGSWLSSSSAWGNSSKQQQQQRASTEIPTGLHTGVRGSDASWEVRAFAEDVSSSGQWPPRSYSCSFCQREFRTAQALGGHMNVHRRERAHQNQLAQLRSNVRKGQLITPTSPTTSPTTVDLLSPKSDSSTLMSLSSSASLFPSSPPSQESINSSTLMATKPFLNPDILCDSFANHQQRREYYHPYEKSPARCKPANPGRFSLCLNKVMGEVHEDALVDLELRLGRSSCAV